MEDEAFEDVMADGPTDYSKHVAFVLFDFDKFDAWLDRLKDAHEREVDALRGETYLDAVSDSVLAKHGLVRMPKDADGKVIHIGDVMDTEHFGTVEVEGFVHSAVAFYNYSGQPAYICTAPANTCHYHAPTVEDVLREFALACEDAGNAGPEVERIAAEYAAKLRLAEEGE